MRYKNKKATQVDFIPIMAYRIVAIIVVGIFFIGITWVRFSQPYDIRALEASVIARKSIECLSEKSIIYQNSFNAEKLKSCLDFDEENIFLVMKFQGQNITMGNEALQVYCSVEDQSEGRYFPKCFDEDYRVLDSEEKLSDLNVFIAIEKSQKNVK